MESSKQNSLEKVQECLTMILTNNEDDKVIAGLDILHKLISNILKNPTDQKFRVLKKSNKAIQAKLLSLQPSGVIIEMVEALGYTNLDDEIHAFAGDYFDVLMEGSTLIDNAVTELKMNNMSEEERKKAELIRKNQEEYKAKMREAAEYKKQLEDISMKERKVKQAEKNQDSKGNDLRFGANMVKFEPPAQQRGG